MKVYIYFEGKQVIKATLPKKWLTEECSKIIEASRTGPAPVNQPQMFADHYDKKNPGGELDRSKLQLTELKSGTVLPSTGRIEDLVHPHADLQVIETEDAPANASQNPWVSGGHVPAADRPAAPAAKTGFGETYSKWDRMEFSDDEKDFHPNIDNNLMIRLKREKRAQRKEEEAKMVKQLEAEIEAGNEEAKVKLEEFYATRQLCGDDVCQVKESRSMINSGLSEFEEAHQKAKLKEKRSLPVSEKEEEEDYYTFQQKHMSEVEEFSALSVEQSEDYIFEHPMLLQAEATGHILIHMLELEMNGHRAEMRNAVRQYLMLQNIVDLAKQALTLDELNKETEDFAEKIIARAKVKKQEKEAAALQEDEEEYEEVPYEERLGPGGLDPVEVFPTLPQELQDAFSSKDIGAMQTAVANMPNEEAMYHIKRMTDSGLWVPGGGDEGGE